MLKLVRFGFSVMRPLRTFRHPQFHIFRFNDACISSIILKCYPAIFLGYFNQFFVIAVNFDDKITQRFFAS